MDRCAIGGILEVDITDTMVCLTLKGDFADERRRQENSSKLTRLDILKSFSGKLVDVELQCFDPALPEKTRKAL